MVSQVISINFHIVLIMAYDLDVCKYITIHVYCSVHVHCSILYSIPNSVKAYIPSHYWVYCTVCMYAVVNNKCIAVQVSYPLKPINGMFCF